MTDFDRGVIWGFVLGIIAGVMMLSLTGCPSIPTREEIDAAVWNNNGMNAQLCARIDELCPVVPEICDLKKRGFYRRLNEEDTQPLTELPGDIPGEPPKKGKFELIPFCGEQSVHMRAFHDEDFKKLTDGLLPKEPKE